MSLDDRIGSLQTGRDADLVVLDSRATAQMALRMEAVDSLANELFLLQTCGDDRAVVEVQRVLLHARLRVVTEVRVELGVEVRVRVERSRRIIARVNTRRSTNHESEESELQDSLLFFLVLTRRTSIHPKEPIWCLQERQCDREWDNASRTAC